MTDDIISAGDWLKDELVAAGADEALATNICFAAGQRQAMLEPGDDAMEPCREALARFRNGDWDTPGKELADRLLREKFGNPLDRDKLLAWIMQSDERKARMAEVILRGPQ